MTIADRVAPMFGNELLITAGVVLLVAAAAVVGLIALVVRLVRGRKQQP